MDGQRMANTLHLCSIDYRVFSHSGEEDRNYHPYFIDEETHIQRGYMTSSSSKELIGCTPNFHASQSVMICGSK